MTRFREHCLELLRQVESSGEEVEITRDGKLVARLTPAVPWQTGQQRPWETLRGSGVLMMTRKSRCSTAVRLLLCSERSAGHPHLDLVAVGF